MTKDELEDALIELCQEYAEEQGWEQFNVDFDLNVYTGIVNPFLSIKEWRSTYEAMDSTNRG
mgnify:FL=1